MMTNEINITKIATFKDIVDVYTPGAFIGNPIFDTLKVYIDDYNGIWFRGSEVAKRLGYTNPEKAIRDHVREDLKITLSAKYLNKIHDESVYSKVNESFTLEDEDDKGANRSLIENDTNSKGGDLPPLESYPHLRGSSIIMIREKALYILILKSYLPDAVRFQMWVCAIIENMRKYGLAMSDERIKELKVIASIIPEHLRPIIDKLKESNDEYKRTIKEMQSKVDFYDKHMNSSSVITMTQIAKDFGISANEIHILLHGLGVIYKVHKDWVLYDEYANQELTLTQYKDGYQIITGWTEKGRQFIYDILIKRGYTPNHATL